MKEQEFQYIESDRIQLLEQAVAFVSLFQKDDAAIQTEPVGYELKAYNEALKLLEKEFRKGSTPANTVISSQKTSSEE